MVWKAWLCPILLVTLFAALAEAGDETVVMGSVVTLTGDGSARGVAVAQGLQAAADAINSEGGVLIAGVRRPLVLEIMDDRGSLNRAAALAEVLVWRRSVSLFLGGSNPQRTGVVAHTAAALQRPMIDLHGLNYGSEVSGFAYSIVPFLENRAVSAMTAIMLGYRLAGTPLDAVAVSVAVADPLERTALLHSLVASGFPRIVDEEEDSDLLLVAPGDAGLVKYNPSILVALSCADGEGLKLAWPEKVVVCVDTWSAAQLDGTDLPAWFAALDDPAAREAAVTVLVAGAAIERARSTHGLVLADVLRTVHIETLLGPVNLATGANAAIPVSLFAVTPEGFAPLAIGDPLAREF